MAPVTSGKLRLVDNAEPPFADDGAASRFERLLAPGLFALLLLGLIVLLWTYESSWAKSVAPVFDATRVRWTRELGDAIFGVLAAATGVGLLVRASAQSRPWAKARTFRRCERGVLLLLVLSSASHWMYTSRGLASENYAKLYDVYHYLLGPKYYDELGYFGLYECSVLADAESTKLIGNQSIRDLSHYRFISKKTVLATSHCKDNFTPERWREFVADYRTIAEPVGRSTLGRMIKDYGYNGTPFHALVSGALANSFSLSYASITFATLLDTIPLCALMVAVCMTFGFNLGSLFAIAFFTAFSDRFFYIGGAFFRYHWLYFTGFGLIALYRGRHVSAGILIALAAMLNVFPVMFVLGIGGKGLSQLVRTRTLERRHLRFTLASMGTAAVAFFASLVQERGLSNWHDFFADIVPHSQLLTVSRIGFRYTYLYRGEWVNDVLGNGGRTSELASIAPITYVMMAVGLLGIFALLHRLSDFEATVWAGFGSFFFVFMTVEYYYGIYAFMLLLFSRFRREPVAQIIMALSFLCTGVIYWVWYRTVQLALCNNTLMSFAILVVLTATAVFLDRRTQGRTHLGSRLLMAGAGLVWSSTLLVTIWRWP
jgi:hypothetical protein